MNDGRYDQRTGRSWLLDQRYVICDEIGIGIDIEGTIVLILFREV